MPRPNYTALRRQTLSDKVHVFGFLKGGDTPKISNKIWISNEVGREKFPKNAAVEARNVSTSHKDFGRSFIYK